MKVIETIPHPRGMGGSALPLTIIALIGLGLRTSVSALAPLYLVLTSEIDLTAQTFALLGVLPPLCFAFCGFLTPRLVRAWGLEPTLCAAALGTSVATTIRAAAPDSTVLMVASVAAFLCVGVENVVMPGLIKTYFFRRVGRATAGYTALVAAGSALPPLLAPFFVDAGLWRWSLALWALIAVTSTVPCLMLLVRTRGDQHRRLMAVDAPAPDPLVPSPIVVASSEPALPVYRSPVAWSVTIALSVTSVLGYFLFAWLPTMLTDLTSIDPAGASLLLALFAAIGFPVYAIGPLITEQTRRPWILYVVSGGMLVVGLGGLLLAPSRATVVWILLLGLAQLLYAIAMTLVNVRTETLRGVTALSGFMQGIAYTAGALGMWVLSAIYIATGSWTNVLVVLIILSVGGALSGFALGSRTLESDLGINDEKRRDSQGGD